MPNPDGTLTQAEWYAQVYPNFNPNNAPINQAGQGLVNFFQPPNVGASPIARMYQGAYGSQVPFQSPPMPNLPSYAGAAAPQPPAPPTGFNPNVGMGYASNPAYTQSVGGTLGFNPALAKAQGVAGQAPAYIQDAFKNYYTQNPQGASATYPNQGQAATTNAPGTTTAAPSGGFNPLAFIQNPVNAVQNWQKNVSQYAGMTPKGGAGAGAGDNGTGQGAGTGTGAGAGGQQGESWVDNKGYKRHKDPFIDYSYRTLDRNLGDGFTDQFIDRMGTDPITFYQKPFLNEDGAQGWQLPDERGDRGRAYLLNRAADAAEKDARFLPSATARWRELHGDTPIPTEMFEKWWGMSQGGYYQDREGRPYGVA